MEDILVPEVKGTIQSNHLRKKKKLNSSHRSAEKSPTQTMHPVDPPPSLGVPHLTSPQAPNILNSRSEFSGLPTFLFHGSFLWVRRGDPDPGHVIYLFRPPIFHRHSKHVVPVIHEVFALGAVASGQVHHLVTDCCIFLLVSSHISAP